MAKKAKQKIFASLYISLQVNPLEIYRQSYVNLS